MIVEFMVVEECIIDFNRNLKISFVVLNYWDFNVLVNGFIIGIRMDLLKDGDVICIK